MKTLKRLVARVRNLATRRRGDERLRQEMEEHLALQTEENIRAGMSPAEARRQALQKFGPIEAIRESYHSEEGLPFLEHMLRDARYALRGLRTSPGFTAVAVLTLALGIGANAAIFTLLDAIMLRNLPVTDPGTLVRVGDHDDCCVGGGMPENGNYSLFSTEAWQQLRKNTPEFADLAAIQAGFEYRPLTARRERTKENASSIMGEFVSGNYFRTLGLRPASGRLLTDSDDVEGAPITAVMSFETWKNKYSSDPTVVDSTFFVNTQPVVIVGIAPRDFYGDRIASAPPELYLPLQSMAVLAKASYVNDPNVNWLAIIGRVRPGVSVPELQAKLSGLLRQALATTRTYSSSESLEAQLQKVHLVLTPGGAGIQEMRDRYGSKLQMLMAVSGLVLLIACANIANLLLVRGMARKAEMSVRSALGAMRSRLIRQLLTESLILAGIGGLAGIVVAYVGTRMLLHLAFPGAKGPPIDASPSPLVLAFACVLSLFTGVLFGATPAWMAAQAEPAEALRTGSRTVGGATLLQRALVIAQAALSVVLLVGAGLFSQSLNKLQHTDLELDPKNCYIVHFNPQAAGYSPRQVADLYRTIEEHFHAIPGVEKVGISSYTPMEDDNSGRSVVIQGHPDLHRGASYLKANAEYFDSVGTHVLLGRGISMRDTPSSTVVGVLNQSFVKTFFKPGENPIGQHFGGGTKTAGDFEIVGVVADTVYTDVRWKNHAMWFIPILQRTPSDKAPIDDDLGMYAGAIVLRTAHPIGDMESITRRALSGINPNLAIVRFQTFEAQIADRFTEDRMVQRLTILFGALALLLAAVGLYGVTAYTVSRRTGEIGIRMALGAQRIRVVGMILREAMVQILLGLAIGLPTALVCVRFVEAILYEVKGIDAGILLTTVLSMTTAGSVAALIPARRAASIDPLKALRVE